MLLLAARLDRQFLHSVEVKPAGPNLPTAMSRIITPVGDKG